MGVLLNNVAISIPPGTKQWPTAAGVDVPLGTMGFTLQMEMVNKPLADTFDMEIDASYDGGVNWTSIAASPYAWSTPTAKNPTAPPFNISTSWGDGQPVPDKVRAVSTSGSAAAWGSHVTLTTK